MERQSIGQLLGKQVLNTNRAYASRDELLSLGLTSQRLIDFLPKLPADQTKAYRFVYVYQRIIFVYLGSRLDAVPRRRGQALLAEAHFQPIPTDAVLEAFVWLKDKNVLKGYVYRDEQGEAVIEVELNLNWCLFKEPHVLAIANR